MTVERTPASLGGATSHGHLLSLIRSTDGLSRQQLLAETGMSRATLYERLEALLRRGWIYEAEALEATGGRRSRKIRFDNRGRVILALALGQTHATVAVVDTEGSQLRSATVAHDIGGPATEILGRLTDAGQVLLCEGANEVLVGVGVSVPAPVDVASGHVVHPTTLPGWRSDAVVDAVSRVWPVPLVVENDARAAALGEWDAGRGTLVYVKVATGIGCGIVVDGEILRGAHGAAGDIGHIRITDDGPRCRCGRSGCLAAYSSGRALTDRLAAEGLSDVDAIRQAALAGRKVPLDALTQAAEVLGRALAATITTINPDRLVLGGTIGALPVVVDNVRSRVFADVVERIAEGLVVGGGDPHDRTAIAGLAALVMRKVYDPAAIDRALAAPAQ